VRILCLDGGGIRGLFSAYILKKIEEDMKRPTRELFNMSAGTSTGSILASAVVLGKSMTEMVEFYQSCEYPLIIPSVDISTGSIHVFRSKYAPKFNLNEHVNVYDFLE
jgi:patatin-like phospholipase/acyl hydrolase